MNIWMSLGVLAVLIFIAVKIVTGAIKTIVWIIIFALALLSVNYLILPRVEKNPINLGMSKFFKSERKRMKKMEKRIDKEKKKLSKELPIDKF